MSILFTPGCSIGRGDVLHTPTTKFKDVKLYFTLYDSAWGSVIPTIDPPRPVGFISFNNTTEGDSWSDNVSLVFTYGVWNPSYPNVTEWVSCTFDWLMPEYIDAYGNVVPEHMVYHNNDPVCWILDDNGAGVKGVYYRGTDDAGGTYTDPPDHPSEYPIVITALLPVINNFSVNGFSSGGYIDTLDVTLNLSVTNCTKFKISNDNVVWTEVDISTDDNDYVDASYSWTLVNNNDIITVYFRAENDFDFHSHSLSFTYSQITGAFVINNNDDLTNTEDVVLTMAVSNASGMRFKNEEDGIWSSGVPYATEYDWSLKDEHGTRTVFGEFYNSICTTILKDRIALVKSIPPPQLEAVGGNGFIDVTWGKTIVENFLGYNLYRTLISSEGYVRINSNILDKNSYVDEDVVNGIRYYYVATVVTITGRESVASNEASAIPQEVSTELNDTFITFKGNSSNVKVYWTNGNLHTKNGVFKIKGNIEELPKILGTQFESLDIATETLVSEIIQEGE